MKKWILRTLASVVVLGAIAAGVVVWLWDEVERDPNHLVLYGNVDIRQVELAFQGDQRIEELLVEEGDRVTKGQLLARLDTERLEYYVDQAKAQADAQADVVNRLEEGTRPENIEKAYASLKAVQAKAEEARRTYRRMTNLLPTGGASQQQVDDAEAALRSTAAQVEEAEATVELAVIGPRWQDIEAAKAQLRAYEAQWALARRNLEDAQLFAPCDGVVQNRILEPGDMASPRKPVFTIAMTNPLWVRAYVSETDLGKIAYGMAAEVTTDSFPGKRYRGWVGYISPTAEFTPKPVETTELRTKLVYQVRIYVDNPENELRLGMPATVTIALDASGASPEEEKAADPSYSGANK